MTRYLSLKISPKGECGLSLNCVCQYLLSINRNISMSFHIPDGELLMTSVVQDQLYEEK